LISGDLGFEKKKKKNGLDLRTSEEREDARKHFFLQQFGDRRLNKGVIGKIRKKSHKSLILSGKRCNLRHKSLLWRVPKGPSKVQRMDLINLVWNTPNCGKNFWRVTVQYPAICFHYSLLGNRHHNTPM
jgi:hypothetical protein